MAERNREPRRPVEIVSPKGGSAYRIGGRLVLTARHLFPDGVGSRCEVRDRLSFEAEAEVVWIAPKVDVALVALPESVAPCQPVTFGRLPDEPLEETIRFSMYGWPQWAETVRGRRVMAGGRRLPGRIFLDDLSPEGLLVLELDRGPEVPRSNAQGSDWSGLSGAAVVCKGIVIAVQRQDPNPGHARGLEAAPLSKVYTDAGWRHWLETHGIESEPVDVIVMRKAWQANHYQLVIDIMTTEFIGLGDDLKEIAEEVVKMAGESASDVNPKYSCEDLAPPLATCLVNHRPVSEVTSCLLRLMKQGNEPSRASCIGKVIDYFLPLNYAPHVVDELQAAVADNRLALVEGEVATRTLAEIIMAGYDGKPALFDPLTRQNPDVAGQMALDCEEGPEVGPGEETDLAIGLATRNFLMDLVALKDMVELGQKTALEPGSHQPQHDADIDLETLTRQIERLARQLRASLRSLANNYERTSYCVMAPTSDISQRDFRQAVLELVHEHVPQLIFVELVSEDDPDLDDAYQRRLEDEYQLRSDIKFRLIHTQQGRLQ